MMSEDNGNIGRIVLRIKVAHQKVHEGNVALQRKRVDGNFRRRFLH